MLVLEPRRPEELLQQARRRLGAFVVRPRQQTSSPHRESAEGFHHGQLHAQLVGRNANGRQFARARLHVRIHAGRVEYGR
jgi:hypothetical protein